MIAVTSNEIFLHIPEIREHFKGIPALKDEEFGFYDSFDEMYKDRGKIDIIFNSNRLPEDRIRDFKNLKWIFSYSAGVDMYPLEALKEMGVILTNTSGIHKTNIAEQVLGGMIMFSRNFLQAMRNKEEKKWKNFPVDELWYKKLLVVGTGAIGREIGRKAAAFDMVCHGVRSRKGEDLPEFSEIFTTEDLHDILGGYDFIVSVLPSTEKTRGYFSEKEFSLMNEKAIFINVGRGDAVVEEDLIEALRKGRIQGAYLDVFYKEPLPETSPLWDMENVIITPHVAGPTPHYMDRAVDIFVENLRRFREGTDLVNVIDYDRKY